MDIILFLDDLGLDQILGKKIEEKEVEVVIEKEIGAEIEVEIEEIGKLFLLITTLLLYIILCISDQ